MIWTIFFGALMSGLRNTPGCPIDDALFPTVEAGERSRTASAALVVQGPSRHAIERAITDGTRVDSTPIALALLCLSR
jgi:hypothetical protein